MVSEKPSLFARLGLAWRVLFSASLAASLKEVMAGGPALPPPQEPQEPENTPEPPPAAKIEAASPDAAMQLLGLLQREGRFVDFLQEDVSAFSDDEIGAAARVVHEGCAKALEEHFEIGAIRSEAEGDSVTLEAGFDPASVRLTGNVVGEAPFRGTMQHRGWRVEKVNLPKLAEDHDVSIVAPAEVEL